MLSDPFRSAPFWPFSAAPAPVFLAVFDPAPVFLPFFSALMVFFAAVLDRPCAYLEVLLWAPFNRFVLNRFGPFWPICFSTAPFDRADAAPAPDPFSTDFFFQPFLTAPAPRGFCSWTFCREYYIYIYILYYIYIYMLRYCTYLELRFSAPF